MRRKEKEITDRREIDGIMRSCSVCRLGLARENVPYIIPVSFGYDGAAILFSYSPERAENRFYGSQ